MSPLFWAVLLIGGFMVIALALRVLQRSPARQAARPERAEATQAAPVPATRH